ncbi:MAG: hypothetical protein ACKOQY_05255 [Bacteroidota bacterium]
MPWKTVGINEAYWSFSSWLYPARLRISVAYTPTKTSLYTARPGAYTAARYTLDQMPYKSLHMFARFPQGLPSGISLQDIYREP